MSNYTKLSLNNRKSNIEALRILAMSMVVLCHFVGHAMELSNTYPILSKILSSFVMNGVNLFFLISGYFLIKFNLKGLVKLLALVSFFGIVNLVLLGTFSDIGLSKLFIKNALMPISGSKYWFLEIYLCLMLVSPILNTGLKHLPNWKLLSTVIVFSGFIFYSCFIGKNMVNATGFSFIQGLYMYVVGYFLSRNTQLFERFNAKFYFGLAILTITILSIIKIKFSLPRIEIGLYNSPFMIISSIFIFLGFSRLNFSSRIINSLAGCSLGVYLLQEGEFGFKFFYDVLTHIWNSSHTMQYKLLIYTAVFIGLWVISWILTEIFSAFYTKFLSRLVSYIYDKVLTYKQRMSSLFVVE